jgi:hypothetical protein
MSIETEVAVAKPRLTYAQFLAQQPKQLTIALLIQRVMDDVAASPTTIRQFGESHRCTLKRMQREPIGLVLAHGLGKHDVIEHCKLRRLKVSPATTKGDLSMLRGVINHAAQH